jgi:hypothetical protein
MKRCIGPVHAVQQGKTYGAYPAHVENLTAKILIRPSSIPKVYDDDVARDHMACARTGAQPYR